MKLTVKQVTDATVVLTTIINERRPMPQRGKYLVARIHAKLTPEFNLLQARRDEMIKAYDTPQMQPVPGSVVVEGQDQPMEPIPGQYMVPADKDQEFRDAWKVIEAEEIDVDVQAIPLTALSLPNGSDGSIQAYELATLGDLVFDNAN